MGFSASVTSAARTNFLRHLRSPALWFVALSAPVAALFMIPPEGADYATLGINNKLPVLTSGVVGITLGIIIATILTPVAYVFLRAGPTRRQPWQIVEVTPHSKMARAIGRWGADTAALWIATAALTVAGVILGAYRLGFGELNVAHIALALWLPSAPSLALIAAIRTLLEARPLTRGWVGDLAFFLIWVALLISALASGAMFESAGSFNPLMDPFGFVGPVFFGVDEPLQALVIGSDSGVTETIDFDAMAGVTDPRYLGARLSWIGFSALIAALAGLVYAPHKLSGRVARKATRIAEATRLAPVASAAPTKTSLNAAPARPARLTFLNLVISDLRLILKDPRWAVIIVAAALAGWILPYRELASGGIWIALLFPLTSASHRWQNTTLRQFLGTAPTSIAMRALASISAGVVLFAAAHIPAIVGAIANGADIPLATMAAISLGIPAAITALATTTRSAVPGRLFLLIGWYMWVASA